MDCQGGSARGAGPARGIEDNLRKYFEKLEATAGFYENSSEGLRHYVDAVNRMARQRGWTLGETLWPHDGRNREWGSGKSRRELFHDYTGRYPRIVPALSLDDGIAAVGATLPHCEFDAGPCADGLKALKAYRKEWDEERGCWRDEPRHDWASHGSDTELSEPRPMIDHCREEFVQLQIKMVASPRNQFSCRFSELPFGTFLNKSSP